MEEGEERERKRTLLKLKSLKPTLQEEGLVALMLSLLGGRAVGVSHNRATERCRVQ